VIEDWAKVMVAKNSRLENEQCDGPVMEASGHGWDRRAWVGRKALFQTMGQRTVVGWGSSSKINTGVWPGRNVQVDFRLKPLLGGRNHEKKLEAIGFTDVKKHSNGDRKLQQKKKGCLTGGNKKRWGVGADNRQKKWYIKHKHMLRGKKDLLGGLGGLGGGVAVCVRGAKGSTFLWSNMRWERKCNKRKKENERKKKSKKKKSKRGADEVCQKKEKRELEVEVGKGNGALEKTCQFRHLDRPGEKRWGNCLGEKSVSP